MTEKICAYFPGHETLMLGGCLPAQGLSHAIDPECCTADYTASTSCTYRHNSKIVSHRIPIGCVPGQPEKTERHTVANTLDSYN
jgi:hypothetical protein